jgi:hypothetical protein
MKMKNLMFLAARKSWMSRFLSLAVPRGLQNQFSISCACVPNQLRRKRRCAANSAQSGYRVFALLITTLIIWAFPLAAMAVPLGLQDVYVFGTFLNTEGQDVTENVIDTALTSVLSPLSIPGGVTFIPSASIGGRVVSPDTGVVRSDASAFFGILQYNTYEVPTAIVSIERSATTPLGTNFCVELSLDAVPNMPLGDTAKTEYIALHTYSLTNESTLNAAETFADRLNAGNFTVDGLDTGDSLSPFDLAHTAMVTNLPTQVIAGSTFWHYFGKGLEVVGESAGGGVGGGLAGAGLGAVITIETGPGAAAGAVVGGIVGGVGGAFAGFLHGLGGAIKDNTQVDPVRPVPEPATMVLLGLGSLMMLIRRRRE